MCLATVYVDDDGQKEEVIHDVAWIESEDSGFLLITLLGEKKLLQSRIKSIDLVNGSIMLEEGEGDRDKASG